MLIKGKAKTLVALLVEEIKRKRRVLHHQLQGQRGERE